jgi:hypothetical protein
MHVRAKSVYRTLARSLTLRTIARARAIEALASVAGPFADGTLARAAANITLHAFFIVHGFPKEQVGGHIQAAKARPFGKESRVAEPDEEPFHHFGFDLALDFGGFFVAGGVAGALFGADDCLAAFAAEVFAGSVDAAQEGERSLKVGEGALMDFRPHDFMLEQEAA